MTVCSGYAEFLLRSDTEKESVPPGHETSHPLSIVKKCEQYDVTSRRGGPHCIEGRIAPDGMEGVEGLEHFSDEMLRLAVCVGQEQRRQRHGAGEPGHYHDSQPDFDSPKCESDKDTAERTGRAQGRCQDTLSASHPALTGASATSACPFKEAASSPLSRWRPDAWCCAPNGRLVREESGA